MKNQVILKQEVYSYGKCECCNKKFNRRTRGFVFGLSNGKYFRALNSNDGDTEKEYVFENVPSDIKLVKVGYKCSQPIHLEIDKQDYFNSLNQSEKSESVSGEFKVWTSEKDFHYLIIDEKGNEKILKRGSEYLNYKIKQQSKN